ncbi:MAG TPA: aminotransferase class I/II-fold pyridoxal phosphate-dependent enzyme [Bacillales bacterium]|nr:aminotransferase class I/II-fold pyridoxal phosphate-dependent enzyme [Bacillales bacterium]
MGRLFLFFREKMKKAGAYDKIKIAFQEKDFQMNQAHTPLYDALMEHTNALPLSFHVPGHKNGMVFPKKGIEFFQSLLPIDLTELPGLDDLHGPTGVIQEAQNLLSALYGTDESRFLVGGSTVGNLAMIRAVCHSGDLVLVQRNSHKSVVNGMRLAGVRPVFLGPEVDMESGLATGPSLATVQDALAAYPEARALILTNPNYHGMSMDLQPLIKEAHRYGVPVLVDEAHGAHFTLGSPFPASALQEGADGVVQSAHKTLPAMTMGAFLHVRGSRINREALNEALDMLQSSSPSYPVMASLDLARSYVAQLTRAELDAICGDLARIRDKLSRFPHFKVLSAGSDAYTDLDPLKLTVQMRCSLTGFSFANRLEEQGIYPELAGPDHVLLVMPLARFQEDDRLIKAVANALLNVEPTGERTAYHFPRIPRLSLPLDWTRINKRRMVPLEEAEGRVAAEEVVPYPPGVPLVIRGEKMTASQIEAVQQWHESGGHYQSGGDVVSEGMSVVVEE